MDLAVGAKRVFVMMELFTKAGESKLVDRCTYPITGLSCVSRVYTDVAIFELRHGNAVVTETVPGVGLQELRERTGLTLQDGRLHDGRPDGA